MLNPPQIFPFILAGGAGKRLWPLANASQPKWMLPVDGKPLILHTSLRARTLSSQGHIGAITHRNQQEQLLASGAITPQDALLIEPDMRDTGIAIASIIAYAELHMPEAHMLLLPADHWIQDAESFTQTVQQAAGQETDTITLFGIVPTDPSCEYGYIECDEAHQVTAFIEKPDTAMAFQLIAQQHIYWNSGIFMGHVSTFVQAYQELAPDYLHAARDTIKRTVNTQLTDYCAFNSLPAISFDRLILESLNNLRMAPLACAWSDVGNYSTLAQTLALNDAHGNQSNRPVHTIASSNNLVWHESEHVELVGVDHLVISQKHGKLLIAHRDALHLLKSDDVP